MKRYDKDENKRRKNLKDHECDFDEGFSVFEVGRFREAYDEENSFRSGEDRFVACGFSEKGNIVLVAYCERPELRLFHCRKLTKAERERFLKTGRLGRFQF